jgi:hypothetical protein
MGNTLLTGFYREINIHKEIDSVEHYYYVIEAVTKINKPSYQTKLPEGDIKLEQVRKNQFVAEDVKFTKWYAGAYTPMRFDVVKKRMEFIVPNQQDRYAYQIERQTTYYDHTVFEISFKPVKNSADYEGKLYIDTDTYAIVKADYQYSKERLRRENIDRQHTGLQSRQFKVNYQPVGNVWHLQSIWQQAAGFDKNANTNYRYITEYATTGIQENTYEDFDYIDKIQWGEVFLTKNTNYDSTFWKDFNIVTETKALTDHLIDTTYQLKVKQEMATASSATELKKTKRKQKRLNPFFTITNYGMQSKGNTLSIAYSNPDNTFSVNEQRNLSQTYFAWSSSFGLTYDVGKNMYVSAQVYNGFSRNKFSGFDIGLGHRFLLSKPNNRPKHVAIELLFSSSRFFYRIADYKNNNITIDGVTFKNDKVRLELMNEQLAIKPKINYEVEINRKYSFYFEVGYLLTFSQRHRLLFSDENKNGALGSIGLNRKTLPFSNERTSVLVNGQPAERFPFENLLYITIGCKGSIKLFR